MDEESFRRFMKRDNKSENMIREALLYLSSFTDYLNKAGQCIDAATERNLEEFISEIANERSIRNMMHGLHYCFQFMGNRNLAKKCIEIRSRYLKRPAFNLKDFHGIPSDVIAKLRSAGLTNIHQMIEAGKTKTLRRGLSQKMDIPLDVIIELVKMSDLARIFGLKAIRARLYHDSGVDTIEKMSSMNSEGLIRLTSNYIKRSDFNGIPPTPKEAEFTIREAKNIARLVEW